LSVLLDRGFQVALVTDGRMSGASGKVPAALHLTPECAAGGPLAKVQTGDLIRLDANQGTLDVLVEPSILEARIPLASSEGRHQFGMGRELFGGFRQQVSSSEQGACTLFTELD
jgi:phosphogluconate dehydratase